jgi:hypothetical protein
LVPRHSNDFVGLRISAPEFTCLDEQSLTDGIYIRPQPRSQDLIDHHRLLARSRVAIIESPAPDDWYAQRLEESRRDKMLRDTDRLVRR